MAEKTQSDHYFQALLASYDALARAMEQANERGITLSRQLVADVKKGQRRAIELASQVAANPSDMTAAYSAVMETAVAAQSQALDFTQAAYREALAASGEAREAVDALLASSRNAAEAAIALSRDWQNSNPWADVMRRGMETFGMAAPEPPRAEAAGKAGSGS